MNTPIFPRRDAMKAIAAASGTAALSIGLGRRSAWAAGEPVVETSFGKVQGARDGGVYSFKGIRYGASTGGENRFMSPQNPEPWAGVQDATHFGNSAPQSNPHPPAPNGPPPIILYKLAPPPGSPARAPAPAESEDCLFLNVWTAGLNDGRKRPVMVWLHGGFFSSGSGSTVNGTSLASRGDVVVVSINHRLNIFGYCHLGDIGGAEFASSGNAGMLDIVAALRWVRDNIERFGGDPSRVMVFGESGGGMKTSFLMASPPAKSLFHRAGMQSGPGLRMMERDAATKVSEMVLAELGLKRSDVNQLRTLPLDQIMTARYAVQSKIPAGRFTDLTSFAPVIDPATLPHHPFDPAASHLSAAIPLLIGSNQTDMIFFMGADEAGFSLDEAGMTKRVQGLAGDKADNVIAAYRSAYPNASPSDLYIQIWSDLSVTLPTIELAGRKAALPGATTYLYQFNWRTPVLNGMLKSLHTLENPFVWNDIDGAKALTGGGADAHALAQKMSAAWVAFATQGDPNFPGSTLPQWPAYDTRHRATMLLDTQCAVANDPLAAERNVFGIQ